ncbi:MAG: hypothetical protein V3T16_06350, partial [Gemmatimonadales bacterium]
AVSDFADLGSHHPLMPQRVRMFLEGLARPKFIPEAQSIRLLGPGVMVETKAKRASALSFIAL